MGAFADCTYNIVSLLKAWKVTVVRAECDDAAFQQHFFRMFLPYTLSIREDIC